MKTKVGDKIPLKDMPPGAIGMREDGFVVIRTQFPSGCGEHSNQLGYMLIPSEITPASKLGKPAQVWADSSNAINILLLVELLYVP